MRYFIVEWAVPGFSTSDLAGLRHALGVAAQGRASSRLTYLGTAWRPHGEPCLSLFRSPSVDAVRRVVASAQAPPVRIIEVTRDAGAASAGQD